LQHSLTISGLVQIAFGRLSTLFARHIRVPAPLATSLETRDIPLHPPPVDPQQIASATPKHGRPQHAAQLLAVDFIRGEWTFDAEQRRFWPRLCANSRFLAFLLVVELLALGNVLVTPRLLDDATMAHPTSFIVHTMVADPSFSTGAQPAHKTMAHHASALQIQR
jgi:hypothetical protein